MSDNLKSWLPGQSGNPAGKPKGTPTRKTILKRFLNCGSGEKDATGKEMTVYEVMILKQIRKALTDDDLASFKTLTELFEGKAMDNKKISLGDELAGLSKEEKEARLQKLLKKGKK